MERFGDVNNGMVSVKPGRKIISKLFMIVASAISETCKMCHAFGVAVAENCIE